VQAAARHCAEDLVGVELVLGGVRGQREETKPTNTEGRLGVTARNVATESCRKQHKSVFAQLNDSVYPESLRYEKSQLLPVYLSVDQNQHGTAKRGCLPTRSSSVQ